MTDGIWPNSAIAKNPGRGFYPAIGLATLAIVLLGFVPTYWSPIVFGAARAPLFVHIHAAFFFGWVVLFVVQTMLVSRGRVAVHRRVGVLAALWTSSTVALGFYLAAITIDRDLAMIDGTLGAALTVIPLSQVCMFSCFVGLGFATLKNRESHKRFMTLAALVALTPAVARIFTAILGDQSAFLIPVIFLVSNGILFGLVWYDAVRRGRWHPVFLWGAVGILLVRIVRVPFSTTSVWRSTAETISMWVTS
jgi:hypothetical protein